MVPGCPTDRVRAQPRAATVALTLFGGTGRATTRAGTIERQSSELGIIGRAEGDFCPLPHISVLFAFAHAQPALHSSFHLTPAESSSHGMLPFCSVTRKDAYMRPPSKGVETESTPCIHPQHPFGTDQSIGTGVHKRKQARVGKRDTRYIVVCSLFARFARKLERTLNSHLVYNEPQSIETIPGYHKGPEEAECGLRSRRSVVRHPGFPHLYRDFQTALQVISRSACSLRPLGKTSGS